LLSAAGLAGCMEHYVQPQAGPQARVMLAPKAMPLICVDEVPQGLHAAADGYARIPAGRPVTLIAQFEGHDFACMPPATFTPVEGGTYEQTFSVRSRACSTTIQQQTTQGIVPVASSEPGSYGCRGRP
jgi:hypothetical protein